jgi:hypothetical protein
MNPITLAQRLDGSFREDCAALRCEPDVAFSEDDEEPS